jgi:hypothetical protein
MDSSGDQFPCEVRLPKLSVPRRNLFRGSMIDICDKKKAAQELLQSEKRVNEAQRVALHGLRLIVFRLSCYLS